MRFLSVAQGKPKIVMRFVRVAQGKLKIVAISLPSSDDKQKLLDCLENKEMCYI